MSFASAPRRQAFYHASFHELPLGTVLRGDYGEGHAWRLRAPVSRLLEARRPAGQVSRTSAVFATTSARTAVKAGGGTDYVYEVEPVGPLSGPFDSGWHSEISRVWLATGGAMDVDLAQDPRFAAMADAYWAGEKCRGKLCAGRYQEYLMPSARIVRRVGPRTRAAGAPRRRLSAAETRKECDHIQRWLYDYLKTDVDPYDFSYLVKDWIEREEIEGFEDPYETYPEDLSQAQLKAFKKWIKESGDLELAIREVPYDTPAYLTLHAESMLPEGSWFVHFTNESFEEFDRGSTLEGLHLSTWKKRKDLANCSKNLSDQEGLFEVVFGFAFDADRLRTRGNLRLASNKYGRSAVLFQCDCAVEAYHDGDEEHQSIFPVCSEYNLHRVSLSGYGELSVEIDGEDVEFDSVEKLIEALELVP